MDNTDGDTLLAAARDTLLAGDVSGLAALVDDDPDLVTRRFASVVVPYDGYFHGATLLHHVAGNPQIGALPPDIVEIARLLLDRGADVDAVTLQGPSQPTDIGWTTLGLAATSSAAREAGVQFDLMDLLVEHGADVDARNGGCIIGALYYGEWQAARRLADRGARLDVVAAAGLGDLDRLQTLLGGDEAGAQVTSEDEDLMADALAHYGLTPWPAHAGRSERLGVALIYAALHGRTGAMELLLAAGADPDGRPPFDHGGTPLHWAVMGDQPEAVRLLLRAGASRDARDRTFDSRPEGWALHLGKTRALQALRGD